MIRKMNLFGILIFYNKSFIKTLRYCSPLLISRLLCFPLLETLSLIKTSKLPRLSFLEKNIWVISIRFHKDYLFQYQNPMNCTQFKLGYEANLILVVRRPFVPFYIISVVLFSDFGLNYLIICAAIFSKSFKTQF